MDGVKLQQHLLPRMDKIHPRSAHFQKDNEPTNALKATQERITCISLDVLNCSSRIPEINMVPHVAGPI